MTFAIATNACLTDAVRLRNIIPSWLRTFADRLDDIVIVVDLQPPTGRIAALHVGYGTSDELFRELDALTRLDQRVRYVTFDPGAASDSLAKRWFVDGKPVRCQGGTPILAFVAAIEAARSETVLRADCDMLFHENGWLARATELLGSGAFDVVEPPRLGYVRGPQPATVSTRALVLRPREFAARRLPIVAHRVDPARRLLRSLQRRAPWLALENMLDCERRRGRLHHTVLDGEPSQGFSLHVATRQEAALPWFPEVVRAVERGDVPDKQRAGDGNFDATAWSGRCPVPGDGMGR